MKVVIVMPAYNAEKTLARTVQQLPPLFDEIILCDDGSKDRTSAVSRSLGITTIVHTQNKGYGANQKTLYTAALERNADIVVMVHPDNQYNTCTLPEMIDIVAHNRADLVLGSRMATARLHNMPLWKYYGNRFLTICQNHVFKTALSEFHSGLRVYNAQFLKRMPFHTFSNNFVFDSEVIAWFIRSGFRVGEVPAECYYTDEVSSINMKRSIVYGCSTLGTLIKYMTGRYG